MTRSSQALYSRRSRREQRKSKSPPLDILFIRPNRRTPRKSKSAIEYLKYMEPFGWTEDGIPIGRSTDDLLDEAYEQGVKAGLDAAQGQAFHRIGEMFYALAKAPDRLRRRIEDLIFRELSRSGGSDDGPGR
jgi:hypothetical protein